MAGDRSEFQGLVVALTHLAGTLHVGGYLDLRTYIQSLRIYRSSSDAVNNVVKEIADYTQLSLDEFEQNGPPGLKVVT